MLPSNPINIYINKINNRLTFKIKDWYKLKLQTPETMKLIWQHKNIINRQNKEWWRWKYQQKSEVSYTFMSNKSYAYLLKVEPNNLMFSRTCIAEFVHITITFTYKNGRLLEIEDKVNLTLLLFHRTENKEICQTI